MTNVELPNKTPELKANDYVLSKCMASLVLRHLAFDIRH